MGVGFPYDARKTDAHPRSVYFMVWWPTMTGSTRAVYDRTRALYPGAAV